MRIPRDIALHNELLASSYTQGMYHGGGGAPSGRCGLGGGAPRGLRGGGRRACTAKPPRKRVSQQDPTCMVLALLRAEPGDYYRGALTKWNVPLQVQWRSFGKPQDAYSIRVVEAHRLRVPRPVAVAKAFLRRPDRNRCRQMATTPVAFSLRTAVFLPGPGQDLGSVRLETLVHVDSFASNSAQAIFGDSVRVELPVVQVAEPFAHLVSQGRWTDLLLLARFRAQHGALRLRGPPSLRVLRDFPPKAWEEEAHAGSHGQDDGGDETPRTCESAPMLAVDSLDTVLLRVREAVAPKLLAAGHGEEVKALERVVAHLQQLADHMRPTLDVGRHGRHSEARVLAAFCASRHFRNRACGLEEAKRVMIEALRLPAEAADLPTLRHGTISRLNLEVDVAHMLVNRRMFRREMSQSGYAPATAQEGESKQQFRPWDCWRYCWVDSSPQKWDWLLSQQVQLAADPLALMRAWHSLARKRAVAEQELATDNDDVDEEAPSRARGPADTFAVGASSTSWPARAYERAASPWSETRRCLPQGIRLLAGPCAREWPRQWT